MGQSGLYSESLLFTKTECNKLEVPTCTNVSKQRWLSTPCLLLHEDFVGGFMSSKRKHEYKQGKDEIILLFIVNSHMHVK